MKWDFEITVEDNLKLKFVDFSNGLSPELVFVNILRLLGNKWEKIGDIRLEIESESAIIHDFTIGSRDKEVFWACFQIPCINLGNLGIKALEAK